jgi:hypothetical protein
LRSRYLYREIPSIASMHILLQPTLIHLYQTPLLLSGPFPIVASASLRLIYSLLYREHINHIQVLGFLPFSRNITVFVLGL